MLYFLSNAFNDPSNPWYYVIGVIFLLLVFAALGVYIWLSGKKSKNNTEDSSDISEIKPDNNAVKSNTDETTSQNDGNKGKNK